MGIAGPAVMVHPRSVSPDFATLAFDALVQDGEGSISLEPATLRRLLFEVETALVEDRGVAAYADLTQFLRLPYQHPQSERAFERLFVRFLLANTTGAEVASAFVALLGSMKELLPSAESQGRSLADPGIAEQIEQMFLRVFKPS
jgi:hypothetical protein